MMIDQQLTDPAFLSGPRYHEMFAQLRQDDPVHWTEGNYPRSFWSLTRHDDCQAVFENQDLFSSAAGTFLPANGKEMTEEERRVLGFDVQIVSADPPVHALRRRPFNKHFSVPAVARFRQSIDDITDRIITDVAGRDEVDLVEDISALLPVHIFLEMLGIPEEDWPLLRELALARRHVQDQALRDGSDAGQLMVEKSVALYEYCRDHTMLRRAHPTDDFASLIANMEIDGRLMDEREAGWMTFTLVAGGLETTRNAAALGFYLLLQHPEDIPRLGDPQVLKDAIEEVLRWGTPSKHKLRVATADTEIRGRRIRKGDWVVPWIVAANRDPEVFPDPDVFDISRGYNPHLSFAAGGHMCLGRNLARLELQVLLPRVLAAFPNMRLVGEPVYSASNTTTEMKRLPASLGSLVRV